MFYNKNGVQVDKARYVVAGETFPINSIASVRAYTVKTGNIARLLLGIILTLIGFSMSIKYRLFSPIHLIKENAFMEKSFSVKNAKINTHNEPKKPFK